MSASAHDSRSVLNFCNDEQALSGFSNDAQLKRSSAQLALTSILIRIDRLNPGIKFFNADADALRQMADRWLAATNGRRYWSPSRAHIDLGGDEARQDIILEYPGDRSELLHTIKGILSGLQYQARELWEISLGFAISVDLKEQFWETEGSEPSTPSPAAKRSRDDDEDAIALDAPQLTLAV